MTGLDVLFHTVNFTVAPFWLLMIVLPHWRVTRWVLVSPLSVVPLPALYAWFVLPQLAEVLPLLLKPNLDLIAQLLGKSEAALVGWIHFLAFDLFVGRWIYLDSRRQGMSAWPMAPILFLVFLLGPCGLLAYLAAGPWLRPKASSPVPQAA